MILQYQMIKKEAFISTPNNDSELRGHSNYHFGLKARDSATIFHIFEKYPEVSLVHIFGSRAKGNFHFGSDIDLAIMNEGVSFETVNNLKNDFEESALPYMVDLVNFNTLKHEDFINHIKRVGVEFYRKKNRNRQNH